MFPSFSVCSQVLTCLMAGIGDVGITNDAGLDNFCAKQPRVAWKYCF